MSKKIIAAVIALAAVSALFASVFNSVPVSSFAEEYVELSEYGEYIRAHWDTIYADGDMLGSDGQAYEYVAQHGGVVEAEASLVTVRGWVVCACEFEGFGYMIEGRKPVFSDDFSRVPEDAIWDVAAEDLCEYAGRFEITADVSGIEKLTNVVFLIKFKTGEIVSIPVSGSDHVGFDFLNPAKQPAEEKDPDAGEAKEPIYIRFDDDFKSDEFFAYAGARNLIQDQEFDYDKKCYVISILGGEDPNIGLPFGNMASDSGFEFFDTVSADDYKALLIISRFDYDTILSTGEAVKGTFYFRTDSTPGEYSETRNMHYTYEKTDELQYVIIDFSKTRAFKGELQDCRFDMFEKTDSDCAYELYYLGFFDTPESAKEFAQSYRENGDSILPTPAPTPEPTPTPEATEAPEVTDPPETAEASEATDAPGDPEQTKAPGGSGKGCGGAVSSAAFVFAAAAAALALSKTKRRS